MKAVAAFAEILKRVCAAQNIGFYPQAAEWIAQYCGHAPNRLAGVGIALMGFFEYCIIFSMVSSMTFGPAEQLAPMTSTGSAAVSGVPAI